MENRIDRRLAHLRAQGRKALAPFVTVGYPDVDTSRRLGQTLLESGADMLELGVPFSDPLADGPTIQMTSQHALAQGVNVAICLETVAWLRERRPQDPLVLMGYYNPFLRFGLERFVSEAARSGADGLIVPDLPPEESGELRGLCSAAGLHLVPLLAPTSTEERIRSACKGARGFIYCVSLTGVTGARDRLSGDLPRLVERIRRHTELPILVGFGISRREHVEEVGRYADGVVVASALLNAIAQSPPEEALQVAAQFVRGLRPEG